MRINQSVKYDVQFVVFISKGLANNHIEPENNIPIKLKKKRDGFKLMT